MSPRVADLIRRAITRMLVDSDRLFTEVDGAVFSAGPALPPADSELAAAISASTRSNLTHWATSTLTDPAARVPPNIVPETLELAREIVRRGFDDAGLAGYRVGQNVAWQAFMAVAFELSRDPDELREMLDSVYRSAAGFVDEMLAALRVEIERERELLSTRARSERLEAVMLVLEGAPISDGAASRRLRYELGRRHVAAVIWSDAVGPRDSAALALTAERLGALLSPSGASAPLTAIPNPSSVWAWFAVGAGADERAAVSRMSPGGDIRVAIGRPGSGVDGFRASHREAVETQRMLRLMPAGAGAATGTGAETGPRAGRRTVASFAEVEVASLASGDRSRADGFVRGALGELAGGEPILRETLRAYLRSGCNVSETARSLFTHRNTVLGRIRRAEQLLPAPLADDRLRVGLALELEHWLG